MYTYLLTHHNVFLSISTRQYLSVYLQDLVNRVQQLEAHVTQLRNIVLKNDEAHSDGHGQKKPQREFDFTK